MIFNLTRYKKIAKSRNLEHEILMYINVFWFIINYYQNADSRDYFNVIRRRTAEIAEEGAESRDVKSIAAKFESGLALSDRISPWNTVIYERIVYLVWKFSRRESGAPGMYITSEKAGREMTLATSESWTPGKR